MKMDYIIELQMIHLCTSVLEGPGSDSVNGSKVSIC